MAAGAVLAMGAFGTSTASAASYGCALDANGVAGAISPPVGLTPTTGGSYTFSGSATCTVDGTVYNANISSSGRFDNIICGTGSVYDASATITSGSLTVTATYSISFFGTVGVLTVHTINGGAASGGGAVQIRPKTGDCQSGVSEFFVAGGFAANG